MRLLVGKSIINVISAYAPEMGRPQSEKEDFWVVLSRTMAAIRPDEKLIVYGDMNCHVGEKAEGLVEVHGGQWYELRG